ncbi:MAG: hypothetical protein R6U95_10880 [Bacteroidales bacterium]
MIQTHIKIYLICMLILSAFSCRSIKETKALQDCNFSIASISNVTINGVSIDGKNSFRDLQTQESVSISRAIMSRKIPVDLTTHISVHNPNSQTASLHKLDWMLLLKKESVATGKITESYSIKANETISIPIHISTDIGSVLKTFSVKELKNMMFNLSSTSIPEEAELKIKPSIRVGSMNIQSPGFITVPMPQ